MVLLALTRLLGPGACCGTVGFLLCLELGVGVLGLWIQLVLLATGWRLLMVLTLVMMILLTVWVVWTA